MEWKWSDGNPHFYHSVHVLLYAFTCALLFLTLYRLMKPNYLVPLIASLLYTFHPLHTEVAANIKSADEVLSLLFLLLSLICLKEYLDKNRRWGLPLMGASFFLALLSKESSITYVAVVPLVVYFFSNKPTLSKYAISTGVMAMVAVLYIMIHLSVVGKMSLANVPVVDNSLNATDNWLYKRFTAIYILGLYLKLLFFPHPLSCDYSYNTIPIVDTPAHPGFLLSLLAHIALVGVAVWLFRKKSVISFGILFYIITLSIGSNLVTIIGTNMAERLVFIPSLGFALIIAELAVRLFKVPSTQFTGWSKMAKSTPLLFVALAVVLGAYAMKTMERNKDWHSVSTLFNADVKTVPNSAHMLMYHAGMITNEDSLNAKTPEAQQQTLDVAIKEMDRALEIYEPFPDIHNNLGKCYKRLGNFDMAIKHFNRAIELANTNSTFYNNLGTVYFAQMKYDLAEKEFKLAVEKNGERCYPDALSNLGSVYGTYGELYRARNVMDTAMMNFQASINYFKQTLDCDKEYTTAMKFLAATYKNIGDEQQAQVYQQMYDRTMATKNRKK
jgi:Tfp pilus assembly protein PilF